MKRLVKNQYILRLLKNPNKKIRNSILKSCDDDVIKTLVEIAINTLNGNNKISKKNLKFLKKHKNVIRCLISTKSSLKAKRRILLQRGGFLPVLIGTVLSGIIGKLIGNYQAKTE